MRVVRPITLFLPKLLLTIDFHHSKRDLATTETGTKVEYCCDYFDRTVLFFSGLWKCLAFGLKKSYDLSEVKRTLAIILHLWKPQNLGDHKKKLRLGPARQGHSPCREAIEEGIY